MLLPLSRLPIVAIAFVGAALLDSTARAQSLIQVKGQVIATTGDSIPGISGATFGGTSTFDLPVLDNAGFLVFRGRFTGGGATALNDRAIFRARSRADLSIVIRGGDPAPSLPTTTLNTASTQGLGGSPRLSPNGSIFFSSSLSGPSVITSNDTSTFGGPIGSLSVFAREGDPAPGTAGAVLSSSLSNLSFQPTGFNANGYILFQSATAGGDTTTTNNAGWFSGDPTNLQLVQRKGDVVLGGAVISALGFVSQMNENNQVLHDETLSTTLGTTPATAANDKTLWVYTPGVGNSLLVREGDPAPFTAGGTFNIPGNSWFINTGSNTFNKYGQAALICDLMNGDAVAGVNDKAIYLMDPGSKSMMVRRGAAATGTDATFDGFNVSSLSLNNELEIAFEGILIGGTTTTANDTGIWAGQAGNFHLVMREGDLAPGTPGCTFDNQNGLQMQFNGRGQVLFNASLLGGDVGTAPGDQSALYIWDPVIGLELVLRGGENLEVQPGVFKQVGSFGGVQFNNGDANPLGLNGNGEFALRVNMSDGSGVIVRCHAGTLTGFPENISTASGGTHELYLDAGASNAGLNYLILGSVTGTSPGFTIGSVTCPLNIDPYTNITILNANSPVFVNSQGVLDSAGRAHAQVVIPPGIPGISGITLYHAFLGFNGFGAIKFASEASSLTLDP